MAAGRGESTGAGDGGISAGVGGWVPLVSPTTHFSDLLRRLANNSAPTSKVQGHAQVLRNKVPFPFGELRSRTISKQTSGVKAGSIQ